MVKFHKDKPADTIFLMFLCLLSGVTQLFGYSETPAVTTLVPEWAYYFWAVILFLGSGISLAGVLWEYPKGLAIEIAGRWMLWPSCVAYAGASLFYDHRIMSALLLCAFAWTCYARIRDVNDRIKRWEALANGPR